MQARWRLMLLCVVLLFVGGVVLAQDEEPATPETFIGVMEFIAAELDDSADLALQATSQAELDAALARMRWATEQLSQLELPMTTEACSVRATLAQWADFQMRAFVNYPDRTYDYLYHDARSRFLNLQSNLSDVAADQPYALVSMPGEDTVVDVVEATEAVESSVGELELAGRFAVPGRDTTNLVYSPDGHYLVRVGSQASDWIDLEAEQPVAALLGSRMAMDVAFSTTPQVAASVRLDAGVTTWDIDAQAALVALPSDQLITDVALNSNATLIVGAGNDGVTIWAYTQVQRLLRGSVIHGIAFSPDDSLLVVGVSDGGAADPGVYLYDTATWEQVDYWEPTEADMTVNTLLVSPDNETVAIVCAQTGVRLRSVETGELVRVLEDSAFARDAAFSPDGATLAVVGGSYLQVYDVASGEMLYQQTMTAEDNGYLRVAFSPDGSHVATANTLDMLVFEIPPMS